MDDREKQAILNRYRRWLFKTARQMAPWAAGEWQDLAQEGWIAMWKALKTFDPLLGAEATYLTTAARLRISDVLRRGNWAGTPSVRGHVREKPATPVDTDWGWVDDQSMFVEHCYEDILWAYHRGQIAAALAKLPSKQRAHIEHHILNDAGRRSWRTIVLPEAVRQQLAEDLRHLVDDALAAEDAWRLDPVTQSSDRNPLVGVPPRC